MPAQKLQGYRSSQHWQPFVMQLDLADTQGCARVFSKCLHGIQPGSKSWENTSLQYPMAACLHKGRTRALGHVLHGLQHCGQVLEEGRIALALTDLERNVARRQRNPCRQRLPRLCALKRLPSSLPFTDSQSEQDTVYGCAYGNKQRTPVSAAGRSGSALWPSAAPASASTSLTRIICCCPTTTKRNGRAA